MAPDTFLDGAALAIRSGRIPRDGLVFHHIGCGGDVAQAAASRGIGHAVRAHGFLPHRAALAAASENDVLLLVLPPGPSGRPILTGKLFEYLGLGLPILALAPEGPAASLVREAGAGCVVDPQDAQGVAAALARFYSDTTSTELPAIPDPTVIERFDRRRQAADLAELLDALSGRRPPVMPPVDG